MLLRRSSVSLLATLALPLTACGDDTDQPPIDTIGDTEDSTTTSTSTTDPSTSTTDPSTSTTDPSTSTTDPSTSTGGSTGDEGTSSGGELSFCGDGTVDEGETCDDGNIYDGDGCSSDCQAANCLVPVTLNTIQEGIDDPTCPTVFVQEGTYTENLVIDRSVTIEATPSDTVIIDGDAAGSVVSIEGDTVVTLRNLVLQNGQAIRGAGVLSDALSLSLEGCTVTMNAAVGDGPAGGGIAATGQVRLLGTEVSNNTVTNAAPGARGGGIVMDQGTLTIAAGSRIIDNAVTVNGSGSLVGSGGGVFAFNSAVSITGNSEVSGNTVTVTGDGTGEVFAGGGGLTLEADGEGGVGLLETSDATIANNTVTASGGQAEAQGGGVTGGTSQFSFGPGTLIDGNQAIASGPSGAEVVARGGGVNVETSVFAELIGATVSNNIADADSIEANALAAGGGVAVDAFSTTVAVALTTVSGNSAQADAMTSGTAGATGGGLFIQSTFANGDGFALGSTFSGNDATSGDIAVGGGLGSLGPLESTMTFDVDGCTISGNTAQGANAELGGGIGGSPGSGFVNYRISSTTIANNTAGDNGGGIGGSGLTLFDAQNTLFWDNTSTAGQDCYTDGTAELNSAGYNIFEVIAGCDIVGVATGNQQNQDPGLGTLADNGGPTQTHEITAGMSAENAGNPAGCEGFDGTALTLDQRGLPRVGICDVGSYEIQ